MSLRPATPGAWPGHWLLQRPCRALGTTATPVVFVWFSFSANLEVLRIILVKLLYLWIHPLCYYGLKCLISDAYPALWAREEKSRK